MIRNIDFTASRNSLLGTPFSPYAILPYALLPYALLPYAFLPYAFSPLPPKTFPLLRFQTLHRIHQSRLNTSVANSYEGN